MNEGAISITWLLGIIGASFLASVSVTWALIAQHSSQPHRDAVPWRTYAKDIGELKADVREIRRVLEERKDTTP